jgi:hypothetical protein
VEHRFAITQTAKNSGTKGDINMPALPKSSACFTTSGHRQGDFDLVRKLPAQMIAYIPRGSHHIGPFAPPPR